MLVGLMRLLVGCNKASGNRGYVHVYFVKHAERDYGDQRES